MSLITTVDYFETFERVESYSFVIILLRTDFFRKVYRGRIDLVTVIQVLIPAISNYN